MPKRRAFAENKKLRTEPLQREMLGIDTKQERVAEDVED
jgi:hypothetical protein